MVNVRNIPQASGCFVRQSMSLVDKMYSEALSRMSGPDRIRRVANLFESFHKMLMLQTEREHGPLSPTELRKRVARRMYCSDPATLRLIERLCSISSGEHEELQRAYGRLFTRRSLKCGYGF